MAPSSSGPGRQVLILKIAGSTPAGVTKERTSLLQWRSFLVKYYTMPELLPHYIQYPHQDIGALARASRVPFDWAEQSPAAFTLSMIQVFAEQRHGVPANVALWASRQEFAIYNGHDVGAELLDKTKFAGIMSDLGYRAPLTELVTPHDDPESALGRIAGLNTVDDRRFLKPRFGRQAKGTMQASNAEEALSFVAMSGQHYLVQTVETTPQEWRYALHRDPKQVRDGELPGWRLAFQKYRPSVTGDGERTLAELVRDNPDMPRTSRFKFALHKGYDLARIPEEGEHVELASGGNIGARLPKKAELATLDRFVGQVTQELEAYLGAPLATVCFDLGVKDPDILKKPYDHEELKRQIVFYEYQVPFCFDEYVERIPRQLKADGRPESMVRLLGRAIATRSLVSNSLYVSGKMARLVHGRRTPKDFLDGTVLRHLRRR